MIQTLASDTQLLAGDFSKIVFTEDPHGYTHPDHVGPLTSITTFIKQFQRPFNEQQEAKQKAAKLFVPVEAVLQMWKEKRERAADHGTALHDFIRRWLLGEVGRTDVEQMGLTPMGNACWAFVDYYEAKLAALEFEAVEEAICYLLLSLAGTPDLRCRDGRGRRFVVDWKSNAEFTIRNRWGNCLLPPFQDLDDCDLNLYALQVAMYLLILEWAGYPCECGIVVHIPCDGQPAKAYRLVGDLDLRPRLRAYLFPDNA